MRRQDLDQLEGHIIGSTGIGQKCKYNGVASQHRVVKPLLGKHSRDPGLHLKLGWPRCMQKYVGRAVR